MTKEAWIVFAGAWLAVLVDHWHDARRERRKARQRRQQQAEWDVLVAMCRETREKQLNVRRAA